MIDLIFIVIFLVIAMILLEPHYREGMSGGVEAQLGSGRYTGGGEQGMISPANAAWSNIDAYGGGSITQQTRQQATDGAVQTSEVQSLQQQNYLLQQRLQTIQNTPPSQVTPPPKRWSFWQWLFG